MDLQTQINDLKRKLRCSAEILVSTTSLSGTAPNCYRFGYDSSTGDTYYVNSSGNWALVATGGGAFDAVTDFSVNTNPNTAGTTFNPNTPQLSTVLYVSTIDASQWTWNGTNYVIYSYASTDWSRFGNAATNASVNFVGTTDAQSLVFKVNNTKAGLLEWLTGNTSFGINSLINQIAGSGANTAIGALALYEVTTGTVNTAIGHQAGRGITTGSFNTIIGGGIIGLSPTLSNNIIIADGAGNKRLNFNSTGSLQFTGGGFGTAGQVLQSNGSAAVPTWTSSPSGLTLPISSLTAATATNIIDNVNNQQIWQWNSLAGGTGLILSSNSTAAATSSQSLFIVISGGVNASTSQITKAGRFLNQHSGTSSTNIALEVYAANATNNYALIATSGSVGIGTQTPGSLFTVGNNAFQVASTGVTTIGNSSLTGILNLKGITSGIIGITTKAAAGTWTLTLPDTDGNVGEVLTTDGSGITSWALPTYTPTEGTYTPTITNTVNLTTSSASVFNYSQIGSIISVFGELTLDPTTTATLTTFEIDLPVASSLTGTNSLAGTMADDLNTVGRIRANVANGTAEVRFTPTDVTNRVFSVHFSYKYI